MENQAVADSVANWTCLGSLSRDDEPVGGVRASARQRCQTVDV